MVKLFGKEQLLDAFRRIGTPLGKRITVFLLGGGAMCFRSQKAGTKDLDLVFLEPQAAKDFCDSARKAGFSSPRRLENEYQLMGAYGILEDANEFRLDIFSKTVCGALSLSKGMVQRAEPFGTFGMLEVRLVSNEDVVLFKGITQRARDADDIAAVVRSSKVDWGIILEECKSQSMQHKWYGLLYNKFSEIEEKHGIIAPILDALLELDRKEILKEAYAGMLSRGMGKEDALSELKKKGFTKNELEHLIS